MSETLDKASQKRATDLCTYCPRLCRHACPVGTASSRESLTPRFKMLVVGEWRQGRAQPTQEAAELLWGCSDCGECENACLHENPVGQSIYAARALAQKAGVAPAPFVGAGERFMVQLNPFGESLLAKEEAALGPVARPLSVKQAGATEPVLVVGCETLHQNPALVRMAFSIAKQLSPDVELAHLDGRGAPMSLCCGRTLREAGELEHYRDQQARVREALQNRSAVWVLEGACLEDIQRAAPQAISLAEAMVKAGIQPKRRVRSLTVQLSCGEKKSGADEAVLALAQRAAEEVKTPLADVPFAGCCGGRGGIKAAMPAVAAQMAAGRLEELNVVAQPNESQLASFSATCCQQLGPDTTHLLELFA